MYEKQIQLKSAEEVIRFNKIVNKYPYDMDIKVGHIDIDAKSIMGLFSLDISKTLTLIIHAEKSEHLDELWEQLNFFYRKSTKGVNHAHWN